MIMKQKPIIIWWGVNTSYSFLEEGLRAEEPVPILKKFLTDCATTDVKKKGYINPSGQVGSASDLAHCPAIIDELKNVYGIKSYYDYKLNIDSQNAISTEDYGQDFLINILQLDLKDYFHLNKVGYFLHHMKRIY